MRKNKKKSKLNELSDNTNMKQKKKRGRIPKEKTETTNKIIIQEIIKKDDKLKNLNELNEFRNKNVNIFNNLLNNIILSRNIEYSCYNYSIDNSIAKSIIPSWENPFFINIYLNKSKNLYLNLDKSSYIKNNDFLKIIKKKNYDLSQIAYISPQEIFPSIWKYYIDENKKKESIIKACEEESATNKFLCPNKNCRARKAVYREAQTRSADEPMTIYIRCLVCGKNWKI